MSKNMRASSLAPYNNSHAFTPWLVRGSRRIYMAMYSWRRPIRRAGTAAVDHSFQVTCFIRARCPCSHHTACDMIVLGALFIWSDLMFSVYHMFVLAVRLPVHNAGDRTNFPPIFSVVSLALSASMVRRFLKPISDPS